MKQKAGSLNRVQRFEELMQNTEQLEQAMYALAHDLREPLRLIGTHTELLRRKLKKDIDHESDDMFRSVIAGVDHMRQMIDATVNLGERSHGPMDILPVSTRAVMNVVLQNLPVRETKAIIRMGHLPVVAANREHLLQLFQNLLENALKYRSLQPPEISIVAERHGNEWIFSIRDNGIGIPAEDHEHIFEMFRRGKNNNSRSGNGLGLATCERIVERYDGRIWVESEPGAGSTFYFTLPAAGSAAMGERAS